MGWTDREPYFSMIESRTEHIMETEGISRTKAWEMAYEDVAERAREATDS